ncbi:MAG: cytochrome-c peroxidase [Myxococcales bacterium]|nr:cytochrome-c peroxidase [Myxococcales bacterium]
MRRPFNVRVAGLAGLVVAMLARSAAGDGKAAAPRLADNGRAIRPLGSLGPVPVPPDNKISEPKAELGKLLFFDARLSGDVSTSCASCHDPRQGWGDGGDLSRGYPGTQHWRNSQTVLNSAYHAKLFWAGESTSLEAQANSAITGNLAGNGEPDMIEERLAQAPEYVELFRKAFGSFKPQYPDVLKAIATFERVAAVSDPGKVPFDRFLGGDAGALSAAAQRGRALFEGKARCTQCHDGPLFSDEDYHNLGVPKNPAFESDPQRQIALRWQHYIRGVDEKATYRSADRDLGLFYETKRPQDQGRFRTPSLRELAHTAPYMHNGVFFTLEEVVDFYDQGGGDDPQKDPLMKPLGLTAQEKGDLVEFLNSLSGPPIVVDPPLLPQYAVLK